MEESKRPEFEEFQNQKTEKTQSNAPLVASTKSLVFFNKRSKLQSSSRQLDFPAEEVDTMTVESVQTENPRGAFSVVGEILWLEPAHGGEYTKWKQTCQRCSSD